MGYLVQETSSRIGLEDATGFLLIESGETCWVQVSPEWAAPHWISNSCAVPDSGGHPPRRLFQAPFDDEEAIIFLEVLT